MTTYLTRLWPETPGSWQRALAAALIAVLGATMSLWVVARLGYGVHRPLHVDLWIACAGAVGGIGGLAVTARRFGHPGSGGWSRALHGVTILCIGGSVIAGTLVLPIYGTMFGPLALLTALLDKPYLGAMWLVSVLAVHPLMRRYRIERASIFAPVAVTAAPRPAGAAPLQVAALGRRDAAVPVPEAAVRVRPARPLRPAKPARRPARTGRGVASGLHHPSP